MKTSLKLSLQAELDPKKASLGSLLNALSLLKESLDKDAWVGFYLYDKNSGNLLLGPFEGTPACEIIPPKKGIVGACFTQKREISVPDVKKFPGYISCDARVKSEVCFPLYKEGSVIGVFDLDSGKLEGFKNDLPVLREIALLFNDCPLF